MRLVFGGLLAIPLLLATVPVRAQIDSREGIALQNQILELKHDVQMLREQIASGSGGSSLGSSRNAPPSQAAGDLTASLLERVSRLEEEVRNLRGHVDEVDNARQRQGDDLTKQMQDLQFKLDNAGTAAPATSRAPAPMLSAPASSDQPHALNAPAASTGPARITPEVALQEGNAALARRDYASAETSARQVLAVPRTPRAIEAQYLLAEALAGKRDYAGAAVAFDDAYNRARTGAHAQDSLLGLANALSTLGEKRAACATLDKLKAEFPTPRPDLRGSIVTVRQQAACH